MLFGAAAFKAVHTPLLTTMLMSELASLMCLAGKMQASSLPRVAPCLERTSRKHAGDSSIIINLIYDHYLVM